MAVESTYTPIATYTVTGSGINGITLSSIPQTYTDLVVVAHVRSSQAVTETGFHITTNSGQYFSNTSFWGNGANALSSRYSNAYDPSNGNAPGANATSGIFGNSITHIPNYSNTTTFKTLVSRTSNDLSGSGQTWLTINLVRAKTAVTYVSAYFDSGFQFAVGSNLTVYGIKAA